MVCARKLNHANMPPGAWCTQIKLCENIHVYSIQSILVTRDRECN